MTDQTTIRSIADEVIARNNDGSSMALLDSCYAKDCVSVESVAMPGGPGRETVGIDAIKGKWDWWEANHDVHSASASGPFLHGEDRFGVIFELDVTDKGSGERSQMRELGLYTLQDGKIIREEFYY